MARGKMVVLGEGVAHHLTNHFVARAQRAAGEANAWSDSHSSSMKMKRNRDSDHNLCESSQLKVQISASELQTISCAKPLSTMNPITKIEIKRNGQWVDLDK